MIMVGVENWKLAAEKMRSKGSQGSGSGGGSKEDTETIRKIEF
jgi:hypothetical protein